MRKVDSAAPSANTQTHTHCFNIGLNGCDYLLNRFTIIIFIKLCLSNLCNNFKFRTFFYLLSLCIFKHKTCVFMSVSLKKKQRLELFSLLLLLLLPKRTAECASKSKRTAGSFAEPGRKIKRKLKRHTKKSITRT